MSQPEYHLHLVLLTSSLVNRFNKYRVFCLLIVHDSKGNLHEEMVPYQYLSRGVTKKATLDIY